MEPERLPPLQEYIDTDALDLLVTGGMNGNPGDVRISSDYEHVEVTVDSDGGVEIWTRRRGDGSVSSEGFRR